MRREKRNRENGGGPIEKNMDRRKDRWTFARAPMKTRRTRPFNRRCGRGRMRENRAGGETRAHRSFEKRREAKEYSLPYGLFNALRCMK